MGERAEQAALGYFMAWIKATAGDDQFVGFHSRILDGTNGGIASVRIEVDGVVLAVTPDPVSQAMHAGLAKEKLKAEAIRNLSRGEPEHTDGTKP